MPEIRPVSDLRNNFADISSFVHSRTEPVYLTKNGYGDMIVMSIEAFEKMKLDNDIYIKLKEAELEAKTTSVRYTHEEVFSELRADIQSAMGEEHA